MTVKTIQRTPNLGIGIRLQKLVVTTATLPEPPSVIAEAIPLVSSLSAPYSDATFVHTVYMTQALAEDAVYGVELRPETAVPGVDYVPSLSTSNFSNGVTFDAGPSTMTVPAGVQTFTMTVESLQNPNGSFVVYNAQIHFVVDGNFGISCGRGTILDF